MKIIFVVGDILVMQHEKKIKNSIEEGFFVLHPCIPLNAPNAFASTRISERGILNFQSMIFPVESAISASALVHITTCLTGCRSLLGDL